MLIEMEALITKLKRRRTLTCNTNGCTVHVYKAWQKTTTWWLGGVVVRSRTRDSEVAATRWFDFYQHRCRVIHTYIHLFETDVKSIRKRTDRKMTVTIKK